MVYATKETLVYAARYRFRDCQRSLVGLLDAKFPLGEFWHVRRIFIPVRDATVTMLHTEQ